MILFLKHIAIEGPGTIGDFFKKSGHDFRVIELQNGQAIPGNISNVDAAVILGGPMNVYDEGNCPFLEEENKFITEALRMNIPLLGICLGSQLIAKASGAGVKKSPVKEIGWRIVETTPQAENDALFAGLKGPLEVFQWHEDTFDIPSKGERLVAGKDCPNQAFKIAPRAYGLQFHIEVTAEIIESWINRYFRTDDARNHPDGKQMLDAYKEKKDKFNKQAELIYNNFLKIIKDYKAA